MRSAMLMLVSMASGAAVAQAPIPVERDPFHSVVYADADLRVLEVLVPEGRETLDHLHEYDLATVCIECADTRIRLPGRDWGDVRPRTVGGYLVAEYAGKPGAHAVRNVGKGYYRLVGVENAALSGWSSAPAAAPAADVTIGQESRAFRLYDVRLAAGKALRDHVHAAPTVVVLSAGEVQADIGTRTARRLARAGDWVIVPAGSRHSLAVAAGGAAHLVEIEVR